MERDRAAGVATFFTPDAPIAGSTLTLGEDAAHHMRVRRMGPSDRITVSTGAGTLGFGTIARIARIQVAVDIDEVREVESLPPVHLLVPIADRERMLWLAEKSVELGATTWRPVLWRRSRSVSPRGEGSSFQAKVRARMISALEQSASAWLPVVYPDAPIDRAIAATPDGARLMLDQDGSPLFGSSLTPAVSIAIGPEGGFDPDEREQLIAGGFAPVAIAGSTLRFETAGVAGLALVRASLATMVPELPPRNA